MVVGSGVAASRLSPNDVGLQLLENALATVLGLFVFIAVLAPLSGADLNPVVSLVDTALGRRRWADAAAYLPTGDHDQSPCAILRGQHWFGVSESTLETRGSQSTRLPGRESGWQCQRSTKAQPARLQTPIPEESVEGLGELWHQDLKSPLDHLARVSKASTVFERDLWNLRFELSQERPGELGSKVPENYS